MIEELEHRIRERAHRIWEREGRPGDRAQAHWAMASAEIAAETKKAKPRGKAAAAAEGTLGPSVASAAAPKRRAAAKPAKAK